MKNVWLQLFLGVMTALMLGSYGYTYMAVRDDALDLDHRLTQMDQRLQRIEDYLLAIYMERR